MTEPTFTTSDFHQSVQKQILNAVHETLSDSKLDWDLVAPFLEIAREMCASEFKQGARIRLHTLRAEGDQWVEAQEAFLGISVGDDAEAGPWLSETWWLSDIALAQGSREEVARIARALERTVARLDSWLAEPTQSPGTS